MPYSTPRPATAVRLLSAQLPRRSDGNQHPDPGRREENADPEQEIAPAGVETEPPPSVADRRDARGEEPCPEEVPRLPHELGRPAAGQQPPEPMGEGADQDDARQQEEQGPTELGHAREHRALPSRRPGWTPRSLGGAAKGCQARAPQRHRRTRALRPGRPPAAAGGAGGPPGAGRPRGAPADRWTCSASRAAGPVLP